MVGIRAFVGLAVVGAAGVFNAASSVGMVEVDATVTQIDRTCVFVITEGKVKRQERDKCNSSDEWADVKANKSKQNIVGDAYVMLSYSLPDDPTIHVAKVRYSPKDPEFFSLKADDRIKLMVDPKKPERIRKS